MSRSQFTLVLDHIRRLVKAAPDPSAGADLSDQGLLERFVRSRDEAAFAELMRRHAAMVLGVCRRVLSHSQDAEDAFQATFVIFARRASAVRGSVGAWLHAVAWRAARRLRIQRARRSMQALGSADAIQPDGTAEVTWREVRSVLDEELQRLPEKYRAPLVLCYLEGLTQDEAARRLGWPCGVLRGRLDRGRERLRARLVRRGLGLSAALFGAALAESATAGVPAQVTSELVHDALLVAADPAAAPTAVSAKVNALATEVTRTMIATNIRSAVLAVVALAVLVGGTSYAFLKSKSTDPLAPVAVAQGQPKAERAAAQDNEPIDPAMDMSRARLEGMVVDEAGKPIAGAVVETLGSRSVPVTRSAADGSFRLMLESGSARARSVMAMTDKGMSQGIGATEDTDLSRVAKVRIVMKPARTMNVRVTDAANKPVAGATVGIMDSLLQILVQCPTDSSGVSKLHFPADAEVHQVIGLKPDVGFDYFENYRSWPGSVIDAPPSQVTLMLDGARSISVRTVDSESEPVAGIDLIPWTIKKKGRLTACNLCLATDLKYVTARTKDDGLAAFDWLPTRLMERITFLNRSREYSLSHQPHSKPSASTQTLTTQVIRNVWIRGKVTLPDGKPAAGVLVKVEGRGESESISYASFGVRTGADGNYKELSEPNMSYMIAVFDGEWAAPSRTGIVVRADEPRKDVDFRLDRGSVLRGKVTVGR